MTYRSRLLAVLRTPPGLVALAALALLAGLALLAPPLLGETAGRMDPLAMGEGVSALHPLGTDDLGRDLLARILVATRLSLGLALAA
ncbi:peptide ABC transporter ATP-binding protein, partial [Streptomyces anulatus]